MKIRWEKVSKTDQSSSHNYIGGWCDRTSNVWCDSTAYSDNGKFDDKYCEFCSTDAKLDSRFSHNNQEIMKLVNQVQFNQDQAIKWGISILGSGAGNMMNTTMSAVGSIVSGFATFFIAFSFACYILFRKKIACTDKKSIFAFISKQKAEVFLKICSLTYQTFANFLTGQCVEAVILGSMFVVTLSILKMPYALLIGTLIAFTALIPIFGAFIGCAVGCFLIFMVSPKQAILFIIVF